MLSQVRLQWQSGNSGTFSESKNNKKPHSALKSTNPVSAQNVVSNCEQCGFPDDLFTGYGWFLHMKSGSQHADQLLWLCHSAIAVAFPELVDIDFFLIFWKQLLEVSFQLGFNFTSNRCL